MKKMRKFIRFGKNNCEKPLETTILPDFRIQYPCRVKDLQRLPLGFIPQKSKAVSSIKSRF